MCTDECYWFCWYLLRCRAISDTAAVDPVFLIADIFVVLMMLMVMMLLLFMMLVILIIFLFPFARLLTVEMNYSRFAMHLLLHLNLVQLLQISFSLFSRGKKKIIHRPHKIHFVHWRKKIVHPIFRHDAFHSHIVSALLFLRCNGPFNSFYLVFSHSQLPF